MKKDRLPTITAWVIGIFLGVCGLVGQVWGADWRVPANFPATYDTAYTCFYEDFVLDDSSAGRANDNDYDTTFTYTAGSYLRCIIWYKYDAADEWGTWTWEYNSAAASTMDSTTSYQATLGVLLDYTSTYQGGSGSGKYSVTVVTKDSANNQRIPDIPIVIRTVDQLTQVASIVTGPDGEATYNVDTAKNYVYIAGGPSNLWDFAAYCTVEVSGSQIDTIYGDLNVPAPAPTVNFVRVYLDVGTGEVDSTSGAMIPRDRIEYTLSTGGQPNLRMADGSWFIVSKDQVKRPTTDGRVTFVVPGNTAMIPSGSWYELRYRSLDRRSRFSGLAFKFEVDTLTDPISIIDCEQVP